MTTVAHARNHRNVSGAKIVYIGRPSKYGNPYATHGDGIRVATRQEAIEKFRMWFAAPGQDLLRREAIEELREAVLLCWCHPNPCHGDVIAEFVNQHAM